MRGGLGLIRPCSPCSRLGHLRIRLRMRSSKRNGAKMRGTTRARIRYVHSVYTCFTGTKVQILTQLREQGSDEYTCFTGTKVQIVTQLREQGSDECLTRNGGSTDAYLWYRTLMPEIYSTLTPQIAEPQCLRYVVT